MRAAITAPAGARGERLVRRLTSVEPRPIALAEARLAGTPAVWPPAVVLGHLLSS